MRKSKVEKVMGEYKRGALRSGSKAGPKVKSRKQAVAIAMSEAGKSRPKRPARDMSVEEFERKHGNDDLG